MPDRPDILPPPGPASPTQKKKSRRGSETRQRSGSMFIRLTDGERQEIEAAARLAGMEPGTYARHMALTDPEGRGTASHVTTRPTRLPFRVTDEERMEIKAKAEQAGLTSGSYIRARALKNPVTLTMPRPRIEQADLAKLLGLLGNVSSNVNQIARQLNSDGEVAVVDVREVLAAVQTAGTAIIESLGRAARPRVSR